MATFLPKRIIKETERLMSEPVDGISAIPHEDNLRYFDVIISGPTDSPFAGEFKLININEKVVNLSLSYFSLKLILWNRQRV